MSFISEKSKYLIINEENNICKQILVDTTAILGIQSFLNEIQAHSDAGKTYVFETSLLFIPNLYIMGVNDFTKASFIDEAIDDPYCYDRVLINLGDLGNEKKIEKLEDIFDIIKIIVTEGEYISRKKLPMKGNKWKTIEIEIRGTLGCLYSTVPEDTMDKTSQLESRTTSSSPATNTNEDKLKFMQDSKLVGTFENAYYDETLIELEEFHEFLKYKIIQYEKKKEELVIFVPFIKTFDKVSSARSTGTRKVKQLLTMMETYTF